MEGDFPRGYISTHYSIGPPRPQRPHGHGTGPGGCGGGTPGADDGRPVEELQDPGEVHRAPGGGPECGG